MENKINVSVPAVPRVSSSNRVRIGPIASKPKEPSVRLVRDGQRIESIVVSCACGQEITLHCEYPNVESS